MGYENLEVWKLSMSLVTDIYRILKDFPKEETYALSDQIRRCAVSIPSNIAEGSARNSKKEFIRFLYVSLGSACELDTQILIAGNIGYLREIEGIRARILQIKKMLNSLIASLKKSG